MPGILGIVRAGMAPEKGARAVQDMMQPLLHFPWYRCAEAQSTGVSLGLVSLGGLARNPRCVTSSDGLHIVAFEGELHNAQELRQQLNLTAGGNDAASHATLVLHALRRWGVAAFERCNGLFQIAWWNEAEQALVVACDPGGLRPIYYCQAAEQFAFAAEVKALLALPCVKRNLDYDGLLSFLRHGLPLGGRTFFANVRVLPPGSYARFCGGRLEIQRYWRMRFTEHAEFSERESNEQFLQTWVEVMRDQAAGNFRLGLPLSGGVDSRVILAALMAEQKEVFTFTMGEPGCCDATLAHELAEKASCSNLFSPVVAQEVAHGLERAVYLTDGLFNCVHTNVRRLLPSLVESASLVFDGINAMDGLYDPEDLWWHARLHRTEATQWLRKEVGAQPVDRFALGSGATLNLLHPEALPRFTPALQHDFVQEFVLRNRPLAGSETAVVDLFWLEEFQHRFYAHGPQILRSAVEVRCPFFDKRMLAFIGRLSPRQRSTDKPLQRHAVQQLSPALAAVPWERNGLPLTAGPWQMQSRRAARMLQRKVGTLAGKYWRRPGRGCRRGHMIDYDEMIRTSPLLQEQIHSTLVGSAAQASGLFDPRALADLLQAHLQRQGDYAEIIGRLLTVEHWYQLFVRRAAPVREKRELPMYARPALALAA